MILKIVQWILFVIGVLSLLVGAAVVHLVSRQETTTRSRNALVQSGEIEPVDALVSGKRTDKSTSSTGIGSKKTTSTSIDYRILVQIEDSTTLIRTVNGSDYKSIKEGERFDAYPVDGRYFIPRFDSQTHSYVKWIIFALSSIPMLGAIALLIARMTMAFRARSQEAQSSHRPLQPDGPT